MIGFHTTERFVFGWLARSVQGKRRIDGKGCIELKQEARNGAAVLKPLRHGADYQGRAFSAVSGAAVLRSLLLVAFSLCLVLATPLCAIAEDLGEGVGAEEHNYVDERQIPDGSFLYDTSIDALATADVFYDNTTVVVTGEVVGDRRSAGPGTNCSWITLYSLRKSGAAEQYNPSSVEVYLSDSLADMIDTYGRYNTRGTYVQVSGIYHLACADHDGLSDIHADSLSVTQKGAEIRESFNPLSFLPGIAAVAIGLLLIFIHQRMLDKSR